MTGPARPALPPRVVWEETIRRALLEDLGGAGDVTSSAIVLPESVASAAIAARRRGRVAGVEVVRCAFELVEPAIGFEAMAADGADVEADGVIARVTGGAAAILAAERTALNFLARLCGIATATRDLVAVAGEKGPRVVCTRKTTPGLRLFEKFAVRAGGGFNHRFGLDDAVLIKDNHRALAGGVAPAVERVRRQVGHTLKIEVEVETLEQLEEALAAGVDAVLLDNMSPGALRRAVKVCGGRVVTEASGGITPETVREVADTGVDLISVGWLTHSAPALDVSLEIVAGP